LSAFFELLSMRRNVLTTKSSNWLCASSGATTCDVLMDCCLKTHDHLPDCLPLRLTIYCVANLPLPLASPARSSWRCRGGFAGCSSGTKARQCGTSWTTRRLSSACRCGHRTAGVWVAMGACLSWGRTRTTVDVEHLSVVCSSFAGRYDLAIWLVCYRRLANFLHVLHVHAPPHSPNTLPPLRTRKRTSLDPGVLGEPPPLGVPHSSHTQPTHTPIARANTPPSTHTLTHPLGTALRRWRSSRPATLSAPSQCRARETRSCVLLRSSSTRCDASYGRHR
jgi:hypothetical protein